MNRRVFVFSCLLLSVLLLTVSRAEAQQTRKIPRIGFLEGATVAESQGLHPFRQGLRELGYVDGKNIIVEVRSMEGKPDRIPDLIGELLSRKVDIIVTPVSAGARCQKGDPDHSYCRCRG